MQRALTKLGLGVAIVLVVALSFGAVSDTGSAHYHDGENELYVHLDDHSPGADDASRWYELIATDLDAREDDDRRAVLRYVEAGDPWASDCGLENIDDMQADYGNDYQHEKEGDEGMVQFVNESHPDRADARDEYEENYGEYALWGPDTDWDYVQMSLTTFNRENDVGPSFRYFTPTRVWVSMSGCFTNPTEPGWYRMFIHTRYSYTDSDEVEVTEYVSQWVPICEGCEDEEVARDRLGPPPHERDDTGGTTATATADPATASGSETPGDTAEAESTDETTASPTAAGADGETATEGVETESETDTPADPGGGQAIDATETASEDGAGFGPLAAVGAIAAGLLLGRRRR